LTWISGTGAPVSSTTTPEIAPVTSSTSSTGSRVGLAVRSTSTMPLAAVSDSARTCSLPRARPRSSNAPFWSDVAWRAAVCQTCWSPPVTRTVANGTALCSASTTRPASTPPVRIAISTPVTGRSVTVIGDERAGACSRSVASSVWLPLATAAMVNAPLSSVVVSPVSRGSPNRLSLAVTWTLAIGLPASSTTRPETA
jgi:hypothetical protein